MIGEEANIKHKLFQRSTSKPMKTSPNPQRTTRPLSRRNPRSSLDHDASNAGPTQGAMNRPRTSSIGGRNVQNSKNDTVKMICPNGYFFKGGFDNYKNSMKIYQTAKNSQQEASSLERQNMLKTMNRESVLPGSSCCSRKKEGNDKLEKTKASQKKTVKILAKGGNPSRKLNNRKQLLDLQKENLQNKFSKVSFLKEENKMIHNDNQKSLEPIKRNITLQKKKIIKKKSSSNLKFTNIASSQLKQSFGDSLKLKKFPDFSGPVNTNFKFSTLLPGKTDSLFKQNEAEMEHKAIAIFPIIDKSKDQCGQKFPDLKDNKALMKLKDDSVDLKDTYTPFIRRLPEVKKRSTSKGIESEEKQVANQLKPEGLFDSWIKPKQKTPRPSKKQKSKHRVVLDSIRKSIMTPKKKDVSSKFENN